MKLYVCWGTFQTIRPGGHPCHNAYQALRMAGHDPILSQTRGRKFYLPIDGKLKEISIGKTFVEPTGGEYFFSPSIGFFKNQLAGAAKKPPA